MENIQKCLSQLNRLKGFIKLNLYLIVRFETLFSSLFPVLYLNLVVAFVIGY